MEEAGVGSEVLSDVEGGLAGYRISLVRLPDHRGAAILIGYADGVDDIRFGAGLGGGAGGSRVSVLYLYRLTGKMDVHFFSGDEPYIEFNKRGGVSVAGRTGLARKGHAVGGRHGIEQLILQSGSSGGGESGIDHVISQRLFPQADVGAAVLDIEVQTRCLLTKSHKN